MRRWNGWGYNHIDYPLPAGSLSFLQERVGPGTPPHDAGLDEVLATVPVSRLPDHDLISKESLERLCHARGQSLPDWIALRCGRIPRFPDGVAYPLRAEHVRDLIRFAVKRDIELIPYGGGTSVVGHITPQAGDRPILTVDMRRLSQLRHLDSVNQLATFGAGVQGPDLEAQLRAKGYTLGHFPQSFEFSTLGGWIATRSSGQLSLGYGRIEALFAGGILESPAGNLALPPFPASAAGPDLRQVVLGSEGRLGILTEATIRVTPLPEREDYHAVFFPEFESGVNAARQLMQSRVPLAMLRLSTAIETTTTLALAGHERLIAALEKLLSIRNVGISKCLLLLGFAGNSEQVRNGRSAALAIIKAHGGVHAGRTFGNQWHKGRFHTPYLRNTLWTAGYAVDTVETATNWSNLPAMISNIEAALHSALVEFDERVHVFTHLSHMYPQGASVYTTYLFRLAAEATETLVRWRALKSAVSQAIVASQGTISHQHGVGIDHSPYLQAEKGALGLAAIIDLSRRFDPQGIMNPGKLISP